MKAKFLIIIGLIAIAVGSCKSKSGKMENDLKDFISRYDSVVKPITKEMALAYWNASLSGKKEDFDRYEEFQKKYVQVHTNKDDFNKLESIKASGDIEDSLLSRQLDVLYLTYLSNQVDSALLNEIIEMGSAIEQKYSNFRASVNGKNLSDNEIEDVLSSSLNSAELQNAWEAHKQIGNVVSADIIALVKKRNEQAKQLGFSNYHEMSLKLSEQDPNDIEKLFDELDTLTRSTFIQCKNEIDEYLVKRLKIKKEELAPWHYQNRYFQEAPKIYEVNLDKYYEDKNLEELTSVYYKGIGLPIDDMLAKSDLYEKTGKNQHAYCTDIDNEGDVRVLCNIKSNSYWMNTMLHEYGHAVYDKFIDRSLPYVLRNPAHTFTTEAIAMMFGRLASNPQWIQDMSKISDEEKNKIAENCFKTLKLEQMVFSRWAQVMYRFEKAMYANPDQDLNALWWTLVEKYQMIKKPAGRNQPDWATKIHIASFPCYYHNYLMGELLASQLHTFICTNVLKLDSAVNRNMISFSDRPEVGKYLENNVFKPGSKFYWNEMIERATGEKLTAKYYAKQFVE